jgi:hypothetical protein
MEEVVLPLTLMIRAAAVADLLGLVVLGIMQRAQAVPSL